MKNSIVKETSPVVKITMSYNSFFYTEKEKHTAISRHLEPA